MHISVLLKEILDAFQEVRLNTFIDATLGRAGHSRAILEAHPECQTFVGFDRDIETLNGVKSLLPESSILIHSNYRHMEEALKERGVCQANGILFDLGVSSMQLDQADRGFSFQQDGPLDMRMDITQTLTAEDVVNSYPEDKLADIIFTYGEERASRRIAKAICQARRKARIDSTQKLVKVIESVLPRRGKIHPATRTFQGIRLEVNKELDSLQEALEQSFRLLAPGGVLAVISFHSLEDRIVKYAFRGCEEAEFRILTKKPIVATQEECRANPRSRSAKLRLLLKI